MNWSGVWHMASVVDGDKEFTPVIIETDDGNRYYAYSWSEQDDELVLKASLVPPVKDASE